MKTLTKKVSKVPRKNLSKEEVKQQIENAKIIDHVKTVVRQVFPIIEDMETIYDAQTVVNAASGFISAMVEQKVNEVKVSDIDIDLSKEKETPVTKAILAIAELLKDEPAKDTAQILERLGKTLEQYSCNLQMKKPMSEIKITDILA